VIGVDTFSKEKRSQIMRRVKSKGTTPEKAVRKIINNLGIRCRLNQAAMPGKPDITLAKMKVAVFVNGCFWHRHKNCKEASMPETNIDYWTKKFHKNVIRDKENIYKIKEGGWKAIVVWECETKNEKCLENRLRTILSARMREINLSN